MRMTLDDRLLRPGACFRIVAGRAEALAAAAPGCSTFVAKISDGAPELGPRIGAGCEPRPVGDGCVS
jgi:hypothetical protein